jgi:hypothetical protein
MKINELITSFEIFITNEEREIYENITQDRTALSQFNEREQFIIHNLIRKSLVSKVVANGQVLVIKNDRHF